MRKIQENKMLVGLSLDREIYHKFQELCNKEGYYFSRRVQSLIEREIAEKETKKTK